MTDRELLELAAKAAGIVIDKSKFNGGGRNNSGFDLLGNAVLDWHNGTTWNPLTDDGDALRLAVKLNIDVFFHASRVEGHVAGGRIPPIRAIEREDYGDDPLTATRRAIVRAAAEIGRNMK
jgi:hypothetical protein